MTESNYRQQERIALERALRMHHAILAAGGKHLGEDQYEATAEQLALATRTVDEETRWRGCDE